MPSQSNDGPQVIALPPLILAATLAVSVALEALWPLALPAPGLARPVGILVLAGSIVIAALALREMIAVGTSPDVRKPTERLVTTGVFAWSRNPIYLGMVLLCLGFALIAGSAWLLLLTIVFASVLAKGVIDAEEIYLERKFGPDYSSYKARVRRWI
jgi:protein-S-isoprenylcysteine O-methyltransferase Ste14